MNLLIVKLGATGDVVRTTTLLERFPGHITWITAANNVSILTDVHPDLRCLAWSDKESARDRPYDLTINLEDTLEVAAFVKTIEYRQLYGAYADSSDRLVYTADSNAWFDLSLISSFGRERADGLKLQNRRTYQDLVFSGLGFRFSGEKYRLPNTRPTGLTGDVAVAREAGPVWPMKSWAYYDELISKLRDSGLVVNVLPKRATILEHLADVRAHKCLVSGDSLPMHFALGTNTKCVSLFNCTSPWEIFEYGLQKKIVSKLLPEFFYKRHLDPRATTAISLDEVYDAVRLQLASST